MIKEGDGDRPQLAPISVIIVNHNAGALLGDCIQAVLGQVREVIVVDNASTDDSLAPLRTQADQSVLRLIESRQNLGFAAACNLGVRTAQQPYVLFLNPDSLPAPGTPARLLQVLQQHPEAGMVGGLLLNPDGSEQRGGRRALPTPWRTFVGAFGLTRFSRCWPRLFFDFHLHRQPLPQHPISVEAISGALMLVRREAMEAVGPWDEGYFLHCEDLDWCLRFHQKGWDILFVPDAPVVHHQGTSSRARPLFVAWHKHRGMLRFYRKFFRQHYPGPLMWLVAAGVWLRFGLVAVHHMGRRILDAVVGRRHD